MRICVCIYDLNTRPGEVENAAQPIDLLEQYLIVLRICVFVLWKLVNEIAYFYSVLIHGVSWFTQVKYAKLQQLRKNVHVGFRCKSIGVLTQQ